MPHAIDAFGTNVSSTGASKRNDTPRNTSTNVLLEFVGTIDFTPPDFGLRWTYAHFVKGSHRTQYASSQRLSAQSTPDRNGGNEAKQGSNAFRQGLALPSRFGGYSNSKWWSGVAPSSGGEPASNRALRNISSARSRSGELSSLDVMVKKT